MYVTATSVSISNFGIESLGLVSGMVHAFRSGIPGLLMVLYMYTFSSDYYADESKENRVFIYFCILTIFYLLTNLMGIFIYGTYKDTEHTETRDKGHTVESASFKHSLMRPDRQHKQYDAEDLNFNEDTHLLLETSKEFDACSQPVKEYGIGKLSSLDMSIEDEETVTKNHILHERSDIVHHRTWWESVKMPEFHYLFWPSAIFLGQRSSFGANIRTFADSFNLHVRINLTLLPIISTFSKPLIGLCSDSLIAYIPRSVLLVVWTLAAGLVDVLCIFYMNSKIMQAFAMVTIILCSSFIQTLAPPLMVTILGREFFSLGWAFVTVGWSSFTGLFNFVIGYFYYVNTLPNASMCMGLACYTYYFLILACGCLVSAILYYFLLRKELVIRRTMK